MLGGRQLTEFRRRPFYRGGDEAERREEQGLAVAGNDWGRDGLDGAPHLLGDMGLDAGVDIGECADRAGNGAGGDIVARGDETGAVARKFGISLGELQAERDRLGVNAVAAADGGGQLVLEGAALQHLQKLVQILRSEEHTSELQSLMRISYAVFCLKK